MWGLGWEGVDLRRWRGEEKLDNREKGNDESGQMTGKR